MTIAASLVDDATGEALAETDFEPGDLPPSFARSEAQLEVRGAQWKIVRAIPDGRDAIIREGKVELRLAPAAGAITHEDPTRDDSLPEIDAERKDEGLALPPGDWRQFELVAAAHASTIREEFEAIRDVVAEGKKGAYGRCHVRTRITEPLAGAGLTRAELLKSLDGASHRALRIQKQTGTVKGAFAIPLGDSIAYGVVRGEDGSGGTVRVLGLAGAPRATAPKLHPVAKKHGLLLVDWVGTTIWEAAEDEFVET
jgi:hypothetical protein